MSKQLKRIHVVFKTHLDIGFTDSASVITDSYINDFIPKAMQTAKELRERGGKERLVWTTGSWLIYTYWKKADAEKRAALKEAVEAGDIAWHALPFTTHTELMDADLWEYGLSYSAFLDKEFNKKTIAAKMTDVPGHTLGMVPFLAKRGVKYLHIGVNDGSHLPEVPRIFRWRAPDSSEIIVQYDKSYGETFIHPQLDEALVVINSADNHGAPGPDFVCRAFAELQQRFPGAEICASSLDAFVPNLKKIEQSLPVVTEEIGDTWIHGVGTDPKKVAMYKELLRLRKNWLAKNKALADSPAYRDFLDSLIMIPEHTWGMDLKKYLGDYSNWSIDDFHAARKRDKVNAEDVPPEFKIIANHAKRELEELYPDDPAKRNRFSYSLFESSHKEQRAYIDNAIESLPPALKKEAAKALASLVPDKRIKKGKSIFAGQSFALGSFKAVLGSAGALLSLQSKDGKEFAGEGGLGLYSYRTYSHEDYVRYFFTYNRNMDINACWVSADFGKPGMQYAKPFAKHGVYTPLLASASLEKTDGYDELSVLLYAGADCPRGAPQKMIVRYKVQKKSSQLEVSYELFDKEANRLPESMWVSFAPAAATPARWRFSKMGMLINPLDVVKGGNRSYHAVEFAEYCGADMHCKITPLDTALAALGKAKMLQFDDLFENPAGGVHFNLYNNLWGTNFPMWYGEDIKARFIVELE